MITQVDTDTILLQMESMWSQLKTLAPEACIYGVGE